MEYSPSKLKEKMDKYNFNFKKNYGQNFIIDENIINNIITNSNIDKDTLVIEIGPGAGALTYKLGMFAKNFLKCDVLKDIKKYNYKKLYVVANLPYYITTPIIIKFIEEEIPVDKIVVMVQKEVGDRFKAEPGSKNYNSLSVYLNYYFDIKKILDVSKNVFIPKPNVDSIVVEFTKKEKKYILKDKDLFFRLVRDSFKQKRKTLKNNLKDYDLIKIEEILKKYNLDLSVRAESLPIEIFIDISNNM